MELNEREKNIVNLINQLSEAASDEATTQDAIDRILGNIKQETASDIRHQMENVDKLPERPKIPIPDVGHTNDLANIIANDQKRMAEAMAHQHTHATPRSPLIFTRIREVKAPVKAHPTDAGIDFFVPDAKAWTDEYKSMVRNYSKNPDNQDLVFIGVNGVEVAPGAHVAIPSGIKTIIPPGLAMMMVNKSGVATKMKLDHSACLIDSEYRDELIFCFFNNNQDRVLIEPGMKITQGLIVPVINLGIQEVLNRVYEDMGKQSDRGGGFGSSGQK